MTKKGFIEIIFITIAVTASIMVGIWIMGEACNSPYQILDIKYNHKIDPNQFYCCEGNSLYSGYSCTDIVYNSQLHICEHTMGGNTKQPYHEKGTLDIELAKAKQELRSLGWKV